MMCVTICLTNGRNDFLIPYRLKYTFVVGLIKNVYDALYYVWSNTLMRYMGNIDSNKRTNY